MFKYLKMLRTPKIFTRKVLNRVLNDKQKLKYMSFPEEELLVDRIGKIVSTSKNETVFVFPAPSCPWGYLFQRPQQLARAIAKSGYHVIYMVDTSFPEMPDWGVRGVQEIEKGIYLYNDGRNGRVLFEHNQDKKMVIWQYWPHQTKTLEPLTHSASTIKIYDCIDHLDTFNSYPSINEDYKSSIQQANIVITSARSIFTEVSKVRADCILVPNGVNTDDFYPDHERSVKDTSGMWEQIGSTSDIVIGYYGAIANWFDFDLIEWLADQNPQWTFLIVGEVYPGVLTQVDNLKRRKNIILKPRVPYSEIPQLLDIFDVAMIPFTINDITLNTSPVKVYEYMAGGKQTVCSDMPEVRRLTGVYCAQSREQFQNLLHDAVESRDNANIIGQLLNAANDHSWISRIEGIIHLIEAEADNV
jgi:glycosyltransferase involved in cell wall biosynthesis